MQTTIYKVELEKFDEEIKKPEFKLLLEQGYQIIMYIPVLDQNKPVVILLMAQNPDSQLLEVTKQLNKISNSISEDNKIASYIVLFMLSLLTISSLLIAYTNAHTFFAA
jgi:hypothetical protein